MSHSDPPPSPLPTVLGWLPGTFLLFCILLGAGMVLLTPETYEFPARGSWLQGERTAQFERELDASLPFRDGAIATWGVLEYALFNEGRPGVLIGANDWLFTDEEFAVYPDEAARFEQTLAEVSAAQRVLEARGVTLVVALLPAKARVYREQLGRYSLPETVDGRYPAFREELTVRGVLTPDLLTPMQEAKGRNGDGEAVFLRTDTHWTPFGAQLVADTLASVVQSTLETTPETNPATPPGIDPATTSLFASDYETRTLPAEPYPGDLLAFVPLGAFSELGPPPDELLPRETQTVGDEVGDGSEGGDGLGLFDTPDIPVALVGTSYSANARWNFAGALQEAFGADVLNAAEEGGGPLPPMRAFLEGAALHDTPPELVVWEFPERYIPVPEAP